MNYSYKTVSPKVHGF